MVIEVLARSMDWNSRDRHIGYIGIPNTCVLGYGYHSKNNNVTLNLRAKKMISNHFGIAISGISYYKFNIIEGEEKQKIINDLKNKINSLQNQLNSIIEY